jgi:internalin A
LDSEIAGGTLTSENFAEARPLLAQLTALWSLKVQSLNLRGTKVDNFEPLTDLTALRSLDLGATRIANLEPLKGLTALQLLHLGSFRTTL